MSSHPLMWRTTLPSLLAMLLAAPLAAAESQIGGTIYGHPLRRNEPAPRPQLPTVPPIVFYDYYRDYYYRDYYRNYQRPSDVNVNVTNVVTNYITNTYVNTNVVGAAQYGRYARGYVPQYETYYARTAPVAGTYPVPYWQPELRLVAERAAQTMTTDSADVKSLDSIIAALYDVISGPAGQARNWDRFRSLFAPGARLIPTRGRAGEAATAAVMTPDEYAAASGPGLERNGFFEREIGRTTEQFGRIAHVFSAYDSKRTRMDPQPFARGINSIQLLNDGRRWWIVSVYWDSERPDNPIPAKYLNPPRD